MKTEEISHDVDYGVQSVESTELDQAYDSIRLTSLAAAEELHQFLVLNRGVAEAKGWQVDLLLSQIGTAIVNLRKS